jgi:hypothetical protein
MLKRLLPDDTDVVFQTTFIDQFWPTTVSIRRNSDVRLAPNKPVRLFHGRKIRRCLSRQSKRLVHDERSAASDVVLQECSQVPSGHLECVPQYWE